MKHTKILKEFENSEKLLDLKSVIWFVGLEIKHYQASNRDDVIQIFNQLKDNMLEKLPNENGTDLLIKFHIGIAKALDQINYDESNEFAHTAGNYFIEYIDDFFGEAVADLVLRNVVFELAKISQIPNEIEKESARNAVFELYETIDDTPKIEDFWNW